MPERTDDIRYLRGLAARLRSLASTESRVADQLLDMASEAEARAIALEAAPDGQAVRSGGLPPPDPDGGGSE